MWFVWEDGHLGTEKGHVYGGCKQCKTQLGEKSKYIRQEIIEDKLLDRIIAVAPRNDRVLQVLAKALKESHSEEIEAHNTQVNGINASLLRIKQRMAVMYDDKLDGRITAEFYDNKYKDFADEKETLLNSLGKLESDNTEYYKVGFLTHEIALRAKEIYHSKKALTEERRLLLSYAFSNITILRGEIKPEYTKAFTFLVNWVEPVNEVLELEKSLTDKCQSSDFVTLQPALLPRQDSNLQPID